MERSSLKCSRYFALINIIHCRETELDLDVNHVKNILQTTACRISSIQELVGKKLSFLWILPKTEIGDLPKGTFIITDLNSILIASLYLETLDELLKGLEQQEFNKAPINKFLKDFASKEQLKFSTFMRSLRSILSGLDVSSFAALGYCEHYENILII